MSVKIAREQSIFAIEIDDGKIHTLVEKPMTGKSKEAKELVDLAKRPRAVLRLQRGAVAS